MGEGEVPDELEETSTETLSFGELY